MAFAADAGAVLAFTATDYLAKWTDLAERGMQLAERAVDHRCGGTSITVVRKGNAIR
jgi:hypothetical protein